MAPPGKTFRIFVSSTFSDLKQERNALQERVFPRLRDLCMAHGFRFQAIDLRWGVSEEAALDQQTVRICLEEIARCQRTTLKPNFIVLLGDRYGWCPLPYEIPASEYEEIERRIDDPSSRGLLADWYRRDDNAVPPVYVLQRRTGEYADPGVWEERVERPLRAALLAYVGGMGPSEDDRLKYAASATEQEIVHGALNIEDAGEHVFCFFRSFLAGQADGSVAVRREDGSLSPIDEVLREGEFHHFVDRAPHGGFDPGAYAQLGNLKGRLESLLPGKTMKYEARWTDSGVTLSHLDALCADVFASLSREIMKQISRFEKADPKEQEDQAHEEFGEERARFFIGRIAILDTIRKHIRSESRQALAICGAPGSGKSALMARAVEEAREDHPEAEVIARFIGATPPSSDGRTLLEDLCRKIGRAYGSDEDTPLEYRELVREFPKRLGRAIKEKPLFLFLDALDQLSSADRARSLTWLPAELPENVSLVVSSIPGECTDALARKLSSDHRVELGPMLSGEGANLLDRWLSFARRTLRHCQKSEVLGKFAKCGMPLYLKLAFEEMRRWKSYDDLPPGTDGKRGLSGDVPGLIDELLRRLSREEEHGEILVSRSLGYIAAGKNGLTEDELIDVLSGDSEVIQDFQRRSPKSPSVAILPVVVWSRFRADLEPYLTERRADGTSLIQFYHHQFEEAVARNYLAGDSKRTRHESLARHFTSRPLWSEADRKKTPNLRKLSELPFQQAHGVMFEGLRDTLLDFDFLYAKVSAVGPQPLIEDYELVSLPHCFVSDEITDSTRQALRLAQAAIRLSAHALAGDPIRLAGQLIGRLAYEESPEIKALLRKTNCIIGVPWLRPMTPSLYLPGGALLRTLEGHRQSVNAVAITPDGRRAVSGSRDNTLKVWDLESGEVLRTLEGHSNIVNAVVVTPDGRHAVSASLDDTLKVWDLESGALVQTLEAHCGSVNAVAITPGGRHAVSGCGDGTLKVWDLGSGVLVQTLEGHCWSVRTVAITSDGRYAVSGSDDSTLKMWDLKGGMVLRTMDGHEDSVRSVALTSDGRCAVSGSIDKTLKLWDLESGALLREMNGHGDSVHAVTITSDGRFAVTGSDDRTLKVWDLESAMLLYTLEGHSSYIEAVALTPDGRYAVSGSFDDTLKMWDLKGGAVFCTTEGHSDAVLTVAITMDGQRAVSGSRDKTLKVWDAMTGALSCTLRGHADEVTVVVLTADCQRVVSGSFDGTLKVWDMGTGVLLHTLEGHSDWISTAVLTADCRRAVSGSFDGTLKVWDVVTGASLHTLEGHNGAVREVVITMDSRRVVSGSLDMTLKVWDLDGGVLLHTLEGHSGGIETVALTADGRFAVSGSLDMTLKVWDLYGGVLLHTLEGHSGGIETVVITPDGRYALSGSQDSSIKVWDLECGALVRTLEGHRGWIETLTLTPDGRCVISGSHDSTLNVRELESGKIIADFYGESGFNAYAVAKDGLSIIAAERSGKVHFLRFVNYIPDATILTANISPSDSQCAFGCLLCGNWTRITPAALGNELPCSNCGKVVKLNPFITSTDWLPIENAWRRKSH